MHLQILKVFQQTNGRGNKSNQKSATNESTKSTRLKRNKKNKEEMDGEKQNYNCIFQPYKSEMLRLSERHLISPK